MFARQTADLPDRFPDEYQVHVIYALPADGVDNELAMSGVIAGSIASSNRFFSAASGGKTIRYDLTDTGDLDITFVRLTGLDAEYAANGLFAREAIQADLIAAGFTEPRKVYLVYYDGSNGSACGGAPPLGTGDRFTVLYLQSEIPGFVPCGDNPFAAASAPAGYWEWSAAHEVVHTLGYVDTCSPNYNDRRPAHVGDNPNDLMYAGNQAWQPTTVDPGQDDYFGANVPGGCNRNLFFSAFLEPRDGDQLPPNF